MKLSDRLRPDVECAPWVIEEVKKLEKELGVVYLELYKTKPRAMFDNKVHQLMKSYIKKHKPSNRRD